MSEYEALRRKNLEDNKRILAEIGLLNPFKPLPRVLKNSCQIQRKRARDSSSGGNEPAKKKYIITSLLDDGKSYGSITERGHRRRSSRIQGKEAASPADIEEEIESSRDEEEDVQKPPKDRPMVYGAIPGIEVGRIWESRILCNYDGIHRPTVAGIHPGPKGAYSIALSGGYQDDVDLGDCFTYTGEGGRDLKGTASNPKNLRTAPQSKDQCRSRGNQALIDSSETGFPVRVIRGFKLKSPFAPEEGYRYDGLYKVEKWWYTTGVAGFGVFKFALKRLPNQASPPWTLDEESGDSHSDSQDSGVELSQTVSESTDVPVKESHPSTVMEEKQVDNCPADVPSETSDDKVVDNSTDITSKLEGNSDKENEPEIPKKLECAVGENSNTQDITGADSGVTPGVVESSDSTCVEEKDVEHVEKCMAPVEEENNNEKSLNVHSGYETTVSPNTETAST